MFVSTSVAIPCGDPPTIPNGFRTFMATTFGYTATYTCNTGYQLSGSSTVTCQASGSWSTIPTCPRKILSNLSIDGLISCVCTSVAVPCGDPPTIPIGSRTFTDTTFGKMATYICDDGYQLSGSAAVMCQASGSWSTIPSCNGEQCKCIKSWYDSLTQSYYL